MSILTRDLRFAFRSLRRSPVFTLVAAVTLGLGVGANAAMLGLFDALLVRPPAGVRDPGSVARVEMESPGRPGGTPELSNLLSVPQFEALDERAAGFSAVAAYTQVPLPVGDGDSASEEAVVLASGRFFELLGVGAGAGRVLEPDDDRAGGAAPVAVLAWSYWRRAFGADPAVLGREIRVGGQSLTVVGVAPRGFVGADLAAPALWVPLGLAPGLGFDPAMIASPHVSWIRVLGRIAPGGSRERALSTAQAAILAAAEAGATAPPPSRAGGRSPGEVRVEVRAGGPPGGRPGGGGPERAAPRPPRVVLSALAGAGASGRGEGGPPVRLWYLGVTAAVLLIACANVANLLLARGASREREIAVRLSLGATRRRVAAQLLTEGALLAIAGAVVGIGIALVVWRQLPRVVELPPLPPLLDARMLAVTAGLALATVALFGLAPLLTLRRTDLRGALGRASASIAAGSPGGRGLVVVQFAASVMLLVGAGLFARSLRNVEALDPGFARDRLLVVAADTREAGWSAERVREFWDAAAARVQRLPGVRAAAAGATMPYRMQIMAPLAAEGAGAAPGDVQPTRLDFVAPGFFQTLGIAIEQGRGFTAEDRRGGAPVAVVSRAFARETFGGAPAVGRCLASPMNGGGCMRIVGVAANARFGDLTDDATRFVYQPLEQRPAMGPPTRVLHVRTEGDPAAVVDAIRRELAALDPGAPPLEIRSMAELLAPQLAPWRASAMLVGVFAALGLTLAAVGLYGVVAFLVARRTREFGIRIALGADRGRIVAMVLGDAGRLVAGGALLGLALAAGASRVMRSAVYGVGTLDPLVLAATVALLAMVGVAAAYAPARRATRVDPLVALRAD